jgi:hypothetical protein
MFLLPCEHLFSHPQILPRLHVHLQRVKARSIALTVAFSRTDVPVTSFHFFGVMLESFTVLKKAVPTPCLHQSSVVPSGKS